MIRALLLFLFAATACADSLPWHRVGTLKVKDNYTPVVQLGGSQIRVYSNTDGHNPGSLYVYVGSWSKVGGAKRVLDVTDPRDTYVRTNGVARGASGAYYAVLYTGDGYPTQGGYSPSWATSPDGMVWTWHGPISLYGRNQSSAMNLIVNESRTDAYRCMYWMDLYAPVNLVLVHSANCVDWQTDYKNMWPIPDETPQFVTAVKTPHAYHLMGADTWPTTALRHVVSCDGVTNWRVVETASVIAASKGTNLAYDPATNTLHALTSGVHWTLPERDWGC